MKSTPEPALVLTSVTKNYGKSRGISDVSLSVEKGEVFGFLGPNGAGKSTTINIILDTIRPTSGEIKILGFDNRKDSKKVHSLIGYVSGDMETDPSLTGKQYLAFVANLHGGVKKKTIDDLVARFHCDTSKKIRHLSRGNKQKIGLIAALMHEPELLILDEPTSGLDPLMQAEFNDIIKDRQQRGKTTFMSSHVLSEVQATCHRLGFIRDGKLIIVSTLDQLVEKASRQINVMFTKIQPTEALKQVPGVDNLTFHNGRHTFEFSGDYSELMQLFGNYQILDLQILEPDLEELFMDYYESREQLNV